MAYKINENCFTCGRCYAECRNGTIREGDGTKSVIIPKVHRMHRLVSRPRAASTAAMFSAPEPDPTHKESREDLLSKFKKLHPRKTPAVT